ncbi:MAG: hypothetical protein V4549_07325 [Bacteroidota bacterium]
MKRSKSVKSLKRQIKYDESQIDASLTPLQRAQKEIFKKRVALAEKKSAELGKHYTDRFNTYLSTYFNNFTESAEENQIAYDTLNKSWKKYANEANASQKYVVLRTDTFELEVSRIVKENDQFKVNHPVPLKDDVIDLTNLKSE